MRWLPCLLLIACSKADKLDEDKVGFVRAVLNKVTKEMYPRWAVAHSDKVCPDSLAELELPDPNDPWGHPFEISCTAGFEVLSRGPDGKAGTPDDIKSSR